MKKKKGPAKAALQKTKAKGEGRKAMVAKKKKPARSIPRVRKGAVAQPPEAPEKTAPAACAVLNARQEKFAQLYVSGKTATEAYQVAYGPSKGAEVSASRLLSTAKVAARVKALQEEAAKGAVLSLQETLEYFRKVVLTPIGEVDERSVLCQSAEHSDTGTKFKMPCKLKALELNAKLQGWLREKVEHTIEQDGLATLMTKIRDGLRPTAE